MNDIPPASTDCSCAHCARDFNSRIGLVGHLQIHRTKAGEAVPGAPKYSRRAASTALTAPAHLRTVWAY
ncbi:unnamed protein product [Schistocephalus solidus]|uniref:C2H2-type domain-containing protein n=1 Tax=Schistocephalus solidus TaxID=70667 RepID=A0A183SUT8_SCHSO|nr:unnamed protein product [Schistocephalus solidus]